MRFSAFVLLSFLLVFGLSCRKRDIAMPSYIHIPSISMVTMPDEGMPSHNIEFVNVFINDNSVGIYQVPCTFPVLNEGKWKVEVRPMIKYLAREGYYLYNIMDAYSDTVNLAIGTTDTIQPVFRFIANREFAWLEDFNDYNASMDLKLGSFDTFFIYDDTAGGIDKTPYLAIPMGNGESFFEIETKDLFTLPTDQRDVVLELNYKSNVDFTIGLYETSVSQVIARPTVSPYSSGLEWRKGYIQLRDELINPPVNSRWRVYIRCVNQGVTDPVIYLDNLKLVYRKG